MILLTGASGFIGSHLLTKLISNRGSDKVVVLTSKPIAGVNCILHHDHRYGEDIFRSYGIDTVIHAGAFTPKNAAQANDWEQCDSNIINTHNLLRALPESVSKFIFLSTLDVYGPADVIVEESPLKPVSLYGESKLYCEKQIARWAGSVKCTFQMLRIGHVYGPGEEQYHKIIPNMIRRLIAHQPIQITGTGEDIRSFIYIDDVTEAIIRSIELNEYAGPINIVGAQSISIKDLVIHLKEIAGNMDPISFIPSDQVSRNLFFDNSKMKKLLHTERFDLKRGLELEWQHMITRA